MVKISVIIPVYNVEKHLRECIDSVISQSFGDIEIICINDGSTDNSLNILNSYNDERIRIINQENKGLAASRNLGLDLALGEYVCFLDSDDYLETSALEELYEIAQSNSTDFVIFKMINFDDKTRKKIRDNYYENRILKEKVDGRVFNPVEDIGKNLFGMPVTAPGNLFKKEFIGDMRFPEGLIFEDNPFYTEALFKAKRVYFLDKHLYFRRVRSDSITQSNTGKFSEWIEISKLIVEVAKKYGYYERFKNKLYKKRIVNPYYLFTSVKEEEKEEFFQKIKADFNDCRERYEIDDEFRNLPFHIRLMFNSAIYCENHIEYECINRIQKLKKQRTEINNKIFRIEYEIDVLRKDNKELKKEISRYKKQNNDIFNSRSWKMVKPLSRIRNTFRR